MRVMIIGASTNREKFGNKAVRAYLRHGHDVFPVNPTASEIEGVRAYPNVEEVPGPIDRAAMYLPPEVGLKTIELLSRRGDVGELWLNPGSESPALIAEANRLGLNTIQGCAIVDIGEFPGLP